MAQKRLSPKFDAHFHLLSFGLLMDEKKKSPGPTSFSTYLATKEGSVINGFSTKNLAWINYVSFQKTKAEWNDESSCGEKPGAMTKIRISNVRIAKGIIERRPRVHGPCDVKLIQKSPFVQSLTMKAFMKKIKNFKSETKTKMSLSKKFNLTKDLFFN